MEGREASQNRFLNLVRYFGFTIIAVVVLVAAFLLISRNIAAEIRTVTDQALNDSTRQECASIQKYVGLLTAQTTMIAAHEADQGAKMLVEALRAELSDNATSAEIGFADSYGYLIYGDQPKINVAGYEWFRQSQDGRTHVFLFSRDARQVQQDLLIAAPVYSIKGFSGVLFVTVDGAEVSNRISTLAYSGQAMSIICNSEGQILFSEPNLSREFLGKNLFDLVGSIKMRQKTGALGLAAVLKRGQTTGFSFQYQQTTYYAATTPIGVLDWRVIALVSSETADVVQRQVNIYLVIMLIVMLTVGVSMAAQAYVHEQATVRKLEHDKDLLMQGAERYRIITKLSNEVLFQVDIKSGDISFNDNFEGMFGTPPPLCKVDQIEKCLPLIAEIDHDRFLAMMQRMRDNAAEAHEELRMVQARKIIRWKRIDIFSVFDQRGHTVELVGKIVDVHRQKQSIQRLIRQADSDPLTGLFNRASMERNIKEYLAGEGHRGKHALLMMDFDNFKAVNDTLGHAKGDDLLVSFAAVIRHVFRSGDFSSRIGGDEYMVFLKNISEDNLAQEKAEELRAEMAVLSKKIGVSVSVSIGIAIYRQDADTFDHLYKAADDALYYVKNHGKNAVSFFSACNNPDSKTE